jgi:hypothetical protein
MVVCRPSETLPRMALPPTRRVGGRAESPMNNSLLTGCQMYVRSRGRFSRARRARERLQHGCPAPIA